MVEPVEIEVNGLTLRGKLFKPERDAKDLAVLFLHGWTGKTNEWAAEVLAENGFSSMTFSLSGHNDSDGKLEDQTREKSLQEVLAAYDLFKSKLPESTKIVVAGNSYGGYMATLLSADRPVAALQLRVPANYWDEKFSGPRIGEGAENPEVFKWRHQKLDAGATRALRALHNFGGPIQILEAEKDDIVSHQSVQNYVDAITDKSKLDYHLLKDWGHSMGDDRGRNQQYQEILLTWLNEQV